MPVFHLNYKLADFDKWISMFKESELRKKIEAKHGVKAIRVLHDAKDRNHAITVLEATNILLIVPIFLRIALCACLFFVSSPATSKTKRLASSGDWAYMLMDVLYAVSLDKTFSLKRLCTARTGNNSDFFSVSIHPSGTAIVQVRREQWNWPKRRLDLTVKSGVFAIILQDAISSGNFILHGTAPEGGGYSTFQFMASTSLKSGKIEVFEHRDKIFARFSSHGFKEMLDKAIQCSKR